MAERQTSAQETSTIKIDADRIDIPDRMRALDDEKVAEIAESIARQGLMQPIGVREPNPPGAGGRYTLIWGAHRLAAYRRTDVGRDHAGRQYIPAVCYIPDLPDPWMRILEIEENLRRKELTVEEKAEHTIRLAAELKELESQESRNNSDFSNSYPEHPKPTTGRGHKGIVHKLAEQVNVDHGTVRHRARKASETIGEPVDLDEDSPSELRRKADKLKATPKAKRIRKPKPIDGGREPKPKHEPRPDVRVMVNNLLVALPKNFNAAAWAAEMPGFLRRNTAATIKELRVRLLVLEAMLTGADQILEPEEEVREPTPDPTPGPEQQTTEKLSEQLAAEKRLRDARAEGGARRLAEAVEHVAEHERQQAEQRISPRTGKPVRKYQRRTCTTTGY